MGCANSTAHAVDAYADSRESHAAAWAEGRSPQATLLAGGPLFSLKRRQLHTEAGSSARPPQGSVVDPESVRFEVVRVLGVGGSARVVQAVHEPSGAHRALKVVSKAHIFQSEERLRRIIDEVRIHSQLRHPFVVELHWAFQTSAHLFLEMDLCAGGDLLTQVQRYGTLDEADSRFYVGEILLGLEYVHSRGVLWRDLKPENCLLDREGHIRIADFGLSQGNLTPTSKFHAFVGSAGYWSPEMASEAGHGAPHDMYSLGCLLYCLLTGSLPHFSGDERQMLRRRMQGEECIIPPSLTAAAGSLLRGLLRRSPSERLGGGGRGAQEVKEHVWFQEVDWTLLEKREPQPCFPRFPPIVPDADVGANFNPAAVKQAVPRELGGVADEASVQRLEFPDVEGYVVVSPLFQSAHATL